MIYDVAKSLHEGHGVAKPLYDAAVELIASLTNPAGQADRRVVNMRNNGTLPFLSDETVIEVSAEVSSDGITAVDDSSTVLLDEDGQGMVEYALILSLIAVVAIAALTLTGVRVDSIISQIANSL